jgi:hypothetical protein
MGGDPVYDDYQKTQISHHGKIYRDGNIADGYYTHEGSEVNYVVDKDGNIHVLKAKSYDEFGNPIGPENIVSDKTIDLVAPDGHKIQSGSDEAKEIYNHTDPNDPNKIHDPHATDVPHTKDPDIIPFKASGDARFAVPEKLTNAGVNWSTQAGFLLDTTSDLNSFSDILHDKLTTNAKVQFDGFWTGWSKTLLDMASQTENVAVLLSNAAVSYLQSDLNILKAFHGDPAAEKQIEGDIEKIKEHQKEFKDKYKKEADKYKDVEDKKKTDEGVVQKENVIHVSDNPRGGGQYHYKVDKDGNIIDFLTGKPQGSVSINDPGGGHHTIWSGSQEAKDIYNKGTSDPGSWQGHPKK